MESVFVSPRYRSPDTTGSMEFARTRIVIVGSINMDLVARCQRMPRSGETIHATDYSTLPGGKGANQAVAAARLGADCSLIGRVGDDSYGENLVNTLADYGVRSEAISRTEATSSGLAWIHVDANGDNAITIVAGANANLSSKDVLKHRSTIQSADVLVAQLEVPLETVAAAIQTAKAAGVLTILDPAPAPNITMPNELYGVDVMTPNQIEAETLTGISVKNVESAVRACQRLQERGVRRPVVTLGADGAVFLDETTEVPRHTLPPRVETIDTTAAGDAFAAAVACRLAAGRTLAAAVSFACTAGALATNTLGAQNAMPNWEDVVALEKI